MSEQTLHNGAATEQNTFSQHTCSSKQGRAWQTTKHATLSVYKASSNLLQMRTIASPPHYNVSISRCMCNNGTPRPTAADIMPSAHPSKCCDKASRPCAALVKQASIAYGCMSSNCGRVPGPVTAAHPLCMRNHLKVDTSVTHTSMS